MPCDAMKAFQRIAAILLATLLLTLVAGCQSNTISIKENKLNIKVIVKKKDADFWKVVKMGAEAAGKEFDINVDFDGPVDEKDIDGQIRMVNEAVAQKVDALVLAASDYTKLVPAAENALYKDIPVIIIDSGIKSNKIKNFIGTDNIDAGAKLGQILLRDYGTECNVAVMGFIKGAASNDQREEGFYNSIKDYTSIHVVAKDYCYSDEDLGRQLAEKMIGEHPEIQVFVCLNAYSTVGTARGIKELNIAGKVKLIGFDSTPEEVSFMEKDVIQSLVIQNPYRMGYLGVKYALDAIKNEPIPSLVNTESTIITKENMYLPENQKLVFPFTE